MNQRRIIGRFSQIQIDGCLQRGKNQFVAAQGAEERLFLQCGDEFYFAGDDSGWWSAEQFIAAESDEIDAALDRLRRGWFVFDAREFLRPNDCAATEVFDEGKTFLMRQIRQFLRRRRFNK